MTFPTRLQTVISEGRMVVRSLLRLQCGTGIYGFWNGKGDLYVPEHNLTYWPNTLITVSEPVYGMGTAAATFTIELVAKRDSGLTPDKLLLIENEDYKNRPASVFDAWFDPDTRELLHVEPGPYGFIDTVDHVTEAGEKKLVGNIMSAAIANHREGYRTASNEDQQLVAPGDKFFEFASDQTTQYLDIKL